MVRNVLPPFFMVHSVHVYNIFPQQKYTKNSRYHNWLFLTDVRYYIIRNQLHALQLWSEGVLCIVQLQEQILPTLAYWEKVQDICVWYWVRPIKETTVNIVNYFINPQMLKIHYNAIYSCKFGRTNSEKTERWKRLSVATIEIGCRLNWKCSAQPQWRH